jgi:hypothetical protein
MAYSQNICLRRVKLTGRQITSRMRTITAEFGTHVHQNLEDEKTQNRLFRIETLGQYAWGLLPHAMLLPSHHCLRYSPSFPLLIPLPSFLIFACKCVMVCGSAVVNVTLDILSRRIKPVLYTAKPFVYFTAVLWSRHIPVSISCGHYAWPRMRATVLYMFSV